jgi:Trypsin-like peptidase domain
MSHSHGPILPAHLEIGPEFGQAPVASGVWERDFSVPPDSDGRAALFVILHFIGVNLPADAKVSVQLGYDQDTLEIDPAAGAWTRPINPLLGPVIIRYRSESGRGGLILDQYGHGKVTISNDGPTRSGVTNPDLFLQNSPYVEPTYETRLKCGTFDWLSARQVPVGSAMDLAARASGILVHIKGDHISSCSVTLIGDDIVITAQHCVASSIAISSGSVCFDYETTSLGAKPAGYSPRFFKVLSKLHRGSNEETPDADLDWAILRIAVPSGGLGIKFKRLRQGNAWPPSQVFTVHHPYGAVKKVQPGFLSVMPPRNLHGFDFAGGSSGSGLFDISGSLLGAALSSGPLNAPDPCTVNYARSHLVISSLDYSACNSLLQRLRELADEKENLEHQLEELQRNLHGDCEGPCLLKGQIMSKIRKKINALAKLPMKRRLVVQQLERCRREHGLPTPSPLPEREV